MESSALIMLRGWWSECLFYQHFKVYIWNWDRFTPHFDYEVNFTDVTSATSASTGRLSENLPKIVKQVLWEGNMLLMSNISACVEIHRTVDKPIG